MILTQNQIDTISNLNIDKPIFIPNFIDNLLSKDEFNKLLNLTPFTSTDRFKPTWEISDYRWDLPSWGTGTNHWPISIIKQFLDEGVNYMCDCSRVNPKINNICELLEQKMNRPADAHIYFSKKGNVDNGFGIHKDESHNLIIQVEGKTHWRVGSKFYRGSTITRLGEFYEEDVLSIDKVLEPGDAIFIPSYIFHGAYSLSKRISVSFPIPEREDDWYYEEREWIEW